VRWIVVVACLWMSSPALAQSAGADVVHLEGGGIVRGTIVEHIPGDHTTVLLVTGETRSFPAAAISSVELGGVAPSDGERSVALSELGSPRRSRVSDDEESFRDDGSTVHVEVDTVSRYPLELHRLEGTATGTYEGYRARGSIHADFYSPLCEVPCELELEPGFHAFGVARAGEEARRPPHDRFTVDEDTRLTIHFRSHSALRHGGWIMLAAGLPTGALMVAWGVFDLIDLIGLGLFIPGVGLALFSIIHFFVTAFRNDHLDITAEPLTVRF
jgi:hypothetical protein